MYALIIAPNIIKTKTKNFFYFFLLYARYIHNSNYQLSI